jgi:hypothetical protein
VLLGGGTSGGGTSGGGIWLLPPPFGATWGGGNGTLPGFGCIGSGNQNAADANEVAMDQTIAANKAIPSNLSVDRTCSGLGILATPSKTISNSLPSCYGLLANCAFISANAGSESQTD